MGLAFWSDRSLNVWLWAEFVHSCQPMERLINDNRAGWSPYSKRRKKRGQNRSVTKMPMYTRHCVQIYFCTSDFCFAHSWRTPKISMIFTGRGYVLCKSDICTGVHTTHRHKNPHQYCLSKTLPTEHVYGHRTKAFDGLNCTGMSSWAHVQKTFKVLIPCPKSLGDICIYTGLLSFYWTSLFGKEWNTMLMSSNTLMPGKLIWKLLLTDLKWLIIRLMVDTIIKWNFKELTLST